MMIRLLTKADVALGRMLLEKTLPFEMFSGGHEIQLHHELVMLIVSGSEINFEQINAAESEFARYWRMCGANTASYSRVSGKN